MYHYFKKLSLPKEQENFHFLIIREKISKYLICFY